jgi:hypothetical protein
MVETRRSSAAAGKRPSPSPSSSSVPAPKRPKVRAPRPAPPRIEESHVAASRFDPPANRSELVVLNQAETPASPTASAPGRAEEDSAAATPARSGGSGEDAAAAAAAQKGAVFAGVPGARVWNRAHGGFDAWVQIKERISQVPPRRLRVRRGGRSRSNSSPRRHGRSCYPSARRCGDRPASDYRIIFLL